MRDMGATAAILKAANKPFVGYRGVNRLMPHSVYCAHKMPVVFCTDLRTNSDYFLIQYYNINLPNSTTETKTECVY